MERTKNVFHLHPNRNFLVNGKRPLPSNMVPQTQNGVSSTSCGNRIVSKTVLRMKIHKFCYFPKIETYGKESVVNVQHSETVKRVLRMLLQLLLFLVKAYS